MVKRTTIIETITFLNVVLFLYTTISKIEDFSIFKDQLAESLVLAPISKLIAILLPCIELFLVLMLIVPRWRLKGFYLTVGLMIIFTGYIIILLTSNKQLPCSCGGIIELLSWPQHLIFNSAFIIADIFSIRLLLKQKKDILKDRYGVMQYKASY